MDSFLTATNILADGSFIFKTLPAPNNRLNVPCCLHTPSFHNIGCFMWPPHHVRNGTNVVIGGEWVDFSEH